MLCQHLRGFGNGTNYHKDWSDSFVSELCFLKHHFWSCKCLSVLIWERQYQGGSIYIKWSEVSYTLQLCCCNCPACVGVATPTPSPSGPLPALQVCEPRHTRERLEEPVKVAQWHQPVLTPSWKCSGRLPARGCKAALQGKGCSTHWQLEEEIRGEGNLPVLSVFSELLWFSGI